MIMSASSSLLLAGVFAAILLSATAHVSLTFPPARAPNYDFLDNVRTGGPCGVPASENGNAVTTLIAGSKFNLTFHLAYPHRGGILVNILANNGTPIHMLLGDTWQLTNDSTAFSSEIQLPDGFTCEQCIIQLLRQAQEWVGGYTFWSCADVSIVSSSDSTICQNGGTGDSSGCTCPRRFAGQYCQLENDCEDDSDCNSNGACIDLDSVSYPRKQCFCEPGWFGRMCGNTSPLVSAEFNPSDYTMYRRLSDRLMVFARTVEDGDEIEIALKATTTSFVAVGWRPNGMAATCRQDSPGPYRIGENPTWPNGSIHLVLGIDAPVQAVDPAAEEQAEEGPEEGPPEETPPGQEETPAGEEGGEEEGEEESAGGGLHAMDCTDLVIAAARGRRSRVLDYYTRDRSTPRLDEFYGGSQSITGAVGMEANGTTVIIFRKKVTNTNDVRADHGITRSQMHFIWSMGQVFPDYFHRPSSGVEVGTADNQRFYMPDEIKYHGTRNRGATTLNFYDRTIGSESDVCSGQFSTGCDSGTCDYLAKWDVGMGMVRFHIRARTTGWVSIGFSNDRLMANTDVVIGAADGRNSFVQDRFSTARGVEPRVDTVSNIYSVSAAMEDGFTTISFTRPIESNDTTDDYSLDNCINFVYGWGGSVNYETNTIGYHPNSPIVSNDRVCLPDIVQCPVFRDSANPITASILLLIVAVVMAAVLM